MNPRRRLTRQICLLLALSSLMLATMGGCRRKTGAKQGSEIGSTRPENGGLAIAHRVITLTPSLTEIVFALGAGDRIVGVSDYCDFPPAARQRPKVGSFLSPSIERILALHPDLVLLDSVQHDVAAMLEHAGSRVLLVPMQDLGQVQASLVSIGRALGDREQAGEALRAQLEREIAEVRSQTAGQPPRRVMFVVDRQIGGLRGLVVAGPGSYLDELMRVAGGENIFSDMKARYGKVAVETIEERRPEVILDAVHTEAGQAELLRQDWMVLARVPAVATGQVHVLGSREFVTPGPRIGQVLHELVALLHPKTAAAHPPAQK